MHLLMGRHMSDDSLVSNLRALVKRLNAAWVNRRFDELTTYFHPDVVVVPPDISTRVLGRDACVASYRDFMSSATVHAFEDAPAQIDVTGGTAVAVAPYEIDYEIPSGRWRGTGKDVLVLGKDETGWRVVWRLVLPGEEVSVSGG